MFLPLYCTEGQLRMTFFPPICSPVAHLFWLLIGGGGEKPPSPNFGVKFGPDFSPPFSSARQFSGVHFDTILDIIDTLLLEIMDHDGFTDF